MASRFLIALCNAPPYQIIQSLPLVSRIDKTSFILRRSQFKEFPGKTETGPCAADGYLIEKLVLSGVRHGKIRDILLAHN